MDIFIGFCFYSKKRESTWRELIMSFLDTVSSLQLFQTSDFLLTSVSSEETTK